MRKVSRRGKGRFLKCKTILEELGQEVIHNNSTEHSYFIQNAVVVGVNGAKVFIAMHLCDVHTSILISGCKSFETVICIRLTCTL